VALELIHLKTEGNPVFMADLVRYLRYLLAIMGKRRFLNFWPEEPFCLGA